MNMPWKAAVMVLIFVVGVVAGWILCRHVPTEADPRVITVDSDMSYGSASSGGWKLQVYGWTQVDFMRPDNVLIVLDSSNGRESAPSECTVAFKLFERSGDRLVWSGETKPSFQFSGRRPDLARWYAELTNPFESHRESLTKQEKGVSAGPYMFGVQLTLSDGTALTVRKLPFVVIFSSPPIEWNKRWKDALELQRLVEWRTSAEHEE